MEIKRFLSAAAVTAAVVFAAGCQKQEPAGDGNISLAETVVEFGVDGGSQTVTLHAGMKWELQGYGEDIKQWLSINPVSGSASDSDVAVTLTALPNEGANRTAAITFYGNVLKKATLSISQAGAKGDAVETITIADFLSKKDTQTEYTVAGTVTDKATAEKYWGIVINDGTGELSCPFPANWDEYKDQIALGKKVTIKGVYQYYESKSQDQMKNGTILKVEDGEPVPPAEGEIYVASFASDLCGWTIDNKVLPEGADYIWVADASYNCVKASAYIGGASLASESWLISPEIDLTGRTEAYLEFEQALNKHTSLAVAKEQSKTFVRAEGGEWTEVDIPNWPASLSWSFVNTKSIDLKGFVGKKIQIAFKYTSEAGSSGTWEIKNVKITEKAQEGPKEDTDFTADLTWLVDDVKDIFAAATDATYKGGFAGEKDGIKIGFYKNTSNTDAKEVTDLLKVYKNHVLCIDSEKTLKAVRFTCSETRYCVDFTAIEPADAAVTRDEAALTIKVAAQSKSYKLQAAAGQVRISKIEFDFAE